MLKLSWDWNLSKKPSHFGHLIVSVRRASEKNADVFEFEEMLEESKQDSP